MSECQRLLIDPGTVLPRYCVDRDVESVQENEQTVEVYLVDFCRGELC